MTASTSTKRYAQAAFELAQEKGNLDKWRADIRRISELMEDPEVSGLIESPRLSFELKAKLVEEKLGAINPLVLNLCLLLLSKGKLKDAEQIADEYDRLLDNYHGIEHADVITAIPIDAKDKQKLAAHLETIMGKKIIVNVQVDPRILGGMVARIDGSLIDGSIRNKLELLKRDLVETER